MSGSGPAPGLGLGLVLLWFWFWFWVWVWVWVCSWFWFWCWLDNPTNLKSGHTYSGKQPISSQLLTLNLFSSCQSCRRGNESCSGRLEPQKKKSEGNRTCFFKISDEVTETCSALNSDHRCERQQVQRLKGGQVQDQWTHLTVTHILSSFCVWIQRLRLQVKHTLWLVGFNTHSRVHHQHRSLHSDLYFESGLQLRETLTDFGSVL